MASNSGTNTKNLWLPKSVNPADWKGDDSLSKANVWQRDNFITRGIDADNVMDDATFRDGFTFKIQLFDATKT